MSYAEFLVRKTQEGSEFGFDPVWMPEFLFDFQAEMVEWALRKGRAAIFEDCGMGKTPQGEVARAALELNPDQMRAELIQVAAVAVAMIEGIDAPPLDSTTGMPIGSKHA